MATPRAPFPPLEILREYFRYCPEDGVLRWNKRKPPGGPPGSPAGCMSPDGYYRVRFLTVLYLNHRLIWYLHTGEDPGNLEVDHRDLNRSNNTWKNLRLASGSSNMHNMKILKRNKSGAKGVCWCKFTQRWRAYATVNYKQYRFGYFDTVGEASEAAKRGRELLHSTFTNHG